MSDSIGECGMGFRGSIVAQDAMCPDSIIISFGDFLDKYPAQF